MKSFRLFTLFLLFTIITAFSQESNTVPGELIIMLKSEVSSASLESAFPNISLKAKQVLVSDLNIWLYQYDYSTNNPFVVLNRIRNNSSVAIAQFNHYIKQRSITPNDPSFSQQWSLNNTGHTGGTPDADIDGPEAWGITTGGFTSMGDSIVVAVIDGGFYLTHPDLKFWKNYDEIPGNGIDDDGDGYIDDVNGWNAINNNGNIGTDLHGTHVSGIAGAIGNNNLGISGVNWGVKILAVEGASDIESQVVAAYGYVLKQRRIYNQTNGLHGAFVVSTNSSFGVDYGQPANFPLWCAFYDSLGRAGILSACATANLNINIDSLGDIPTACPSPYMVSVTNTTNTDAKNNGAAYGLTTIDLGAPGTSILSTTSTGNYGLLTGTSMATPHVAGGIALILSAASPQFIQAYKNRPDSMALILKNILLQGVDVKPSLQGRTVSGGRLNVYNSILLIQALTAAENNSNIIPNRFNLYQNYPNPFNPSTVITYDIPQKEFVSLKIYDILGREVAVLQNGEMAPGVQHTIWNAVNISSGIYYYVLRAGDYTSTKKMAIIK